uniref:heme-binding protein n=1 Tax=Candidatus Entotheonella palauensis TaxID=93172 RepID=UPI001C4E0E8F
SNAINNDYWKRKNQRMLPFKNDQLVGSIGVSGDGIDQDDLVAAMGSVGFEAPPEIRSDRVRVRGVRLPFVRFPRNPEL